MCQSAVVIDGHVERWVLLKDVVFWDTPFLSASFVAILSCHPEQQRNFMLEGFPLLDAGIAGLIGKQVAI